MVRRSRIIMSVPPRKPTVGDVTVLPPNPDSDELETYKVTEIVCYFTSFTSDILSFDFNCQP